MESLIVHPKNQMELQALKSTLKDMGIVFEKFHTRNTKTTAAPKKTVTENKTTPKDPRKSRN